MHDWYATLVGLLVVAALLLVGAGSSAARDDEPVSTVFIDGATIQATIQVEATQRGDDPFDVTGTGFAVAGLGTGVLVNAGGPIICTDVRGNTAGGIIRVEESTNPALIGTEAYATVVDGGPGGVDRANILVVNPGPGCAPRPELATFEFTSGDVVITDGTLHGKK